MFELILAEAMAAPGAPVGQQQSIFGLLIPFALLGLFMWLFVFRPQRRQRREHGQMLDALMPEDEILTSGGIVGRVKDIQRNWVIVEVAKGVQLRMQRHAILSVLPKGTIDEVPSAEA
ncbi:MAG: preprotein translocase subunit YajC [Gammaproteobacteria bacterium]|nr:preprotein translocase subunit YajC [Pseudomonadota bacterium]MCH9663086.1 preprotein translocase subunit YajC [Gammaproteobacteria bacterium]